MNRIYRYYNNKNVYLVLSMVPAFDAMAGGIFLRLEKNLRIDLHLVDLHSAEYEEYHCTSSTFNCNLGLFISRYGYLLS